MSECFLRNKKLKFLTAWASSSSKRRSAREQSPSRGRSRSQRSPFTREMTALSARPWLQDKGKKKYAFCASWTGWNQIVSLFHSYLDSNSAHINASIVDHKLVLLHWCASTDLISQATWYGVVTQALPDTFRLSGSVTVMGLEFAAFCASRTSLSFFSSSYKLRRSVTYDGHGFGWRETYHKPKWFC